MGTDDVSTVTTAVLRILKEDYNDDITERIIRERISKETGIDTEVLEMRSVVGDVVKDFLDKKGAELTRDEAAEDESDELEDALDEKVGGDVAAAAAAGAWKRLKDNEDEVVCEVGCKSALVRYHETQKYQKYFRLWLMTTSVIQASEPG